MDVAVPAHFLALNDPDLVAQLASLNLYLLAG